MKDKESVLCASITVIGFLLIFSGASYRLGAAAGGSEPSFQEWVSKRMSNPTNTDTKANGANLPAPDKNLTNLLEQAQQVKETMMQANAYLVSAGQDAVRDNESFDRELRDVNNPNATDRFLDDNQRWMHDSLQSMAQDRQNIATMKALLAKAQGTLEALQEYIGQETGIYSANIVQLPRIPDWAKGYEGTYDCSPEDRPSGRDESYSGHFEVRYQQDGMVALLMAFGHVAFSQQWGSMTLTCTADIDGVRIDRASRDIYLTGNFRIERSNPDHPEREQSSDYSMMHFVGYPQVNGKLELSSVNMPVDHTGAILLLNLPCHMTKAGQ